MVTRLAYIVGFTLSCWGRRTMLGKERKIERKLGIPRRDLGSGSDCLFLSL